MSHYPRHVDKGSSIFDDVNDPTSPTNSVSEKVITKNDDGTVQTVTTELSNKNNGTPKAQGKESDQTINDPSKIYDQPADGNIFLETAADLILGKTANAAEPVAPPPGAENIIEEFAKTQDVSSSWSPEATRQEDFQEVVQPFEPSQIDAAQPFEPSILASQSKGETTNEEDGFVDGADGFVDGVIDWASENPYDAVMAGLVFVPPLGWSLRVGGTLAKLAYNSKWLREWGPKVFDKAFRQKQKGLNAKRTKDGKLDRRYKSRPEDDGYKGINWYKTALSGYVGGEVVGSMFGDEEEGFTPSIAADDKKKVKADAISAFKAIQNDVAAVTKANTIEQDRKVAEQVANNQAQVIASEGETIGRSLIKIALGALAGVSVGAMVGSKGNQVLEDQKLARERTLQQDKYNLDMSKANAKAATKAAGERIKAKNKRWNDVKTTAFKGRVKFDDYGKPKDPGLASQITKSIAAIKLGGEEMNFTSEANLYEAIDRHQKDPKTTILGNYYSKQVLMDGSNLIVAKNEYNNRDSIEHMNSMGYIRAKLSKGGKPKSEVDAQLAGFWESFKKLQDNSDKEFEWKGRFAQYTEALLKGNIK